MTNSNDLSNTSRPHSQPAASASSFSFGAFTPPITTSTATCSLLDILILPPPATPNPFLPTTKSTFFRSPSTTTSRARAIDNLLSAAQAPMPYLPAHVPDSPTERAEDISAVLKRLERTTSCASTDETTTVMDCPGLQHYYPPITHDHRPPGPPINRSLERLMQYGVEDARYKRYLSPSGVFFGSSGRLEPTAFFSDEGTPVHGLLTQRQPHELLHVPFQIGRLPNSTFDRISTASSPDTVDLFSPPPAGIPNIPYDPSCDSYNAHETSNDPLEVLGLTPAHSSVCFEDMLQYVSALDSPSPTRLSTTSHNRQKRASVSPSVAHESEETIQADSPVCRVRSYNGDLKSLAEIYESEPELEADDGSPLRPMSRRCSKSCPSTSMRRISTHVNTPKASLPTPPPTSISAAARVAFEPPASPSPFRQPTGEYLQPLADRMEISGPPKPEEVFDDNGQQYRYTAEAMPLDLDPAVADESSTPPQTPVDVLGHHLLPITVDEDVDVGDILDLGNDIHGSIIKRQRSPESSPDIPLAAKSTFNRLIAADARIPTYSQGQDEKVIEKRLKRQLSATTFYIPDQTPAKRRIFTSTPALADGIERFDPYAKRYFSAPGAPESYTPLHVPVLPYPPAFSAPVSHQFPNRRLSVPIYPVLTPFSLPLKGDFGAGWTMQPREEAAVCHDPFAYTVNLTPSNHSSSLTPLTTTVSTHHADSCSDSEGSDTPDPLLLQDDEPRPGVKSRTMRPRVGVVKPPAEQKHKLRKQQGKRNGKQAKPKSEKSFWTAEEDDVCMDYWDGVGPISLSRMAECGEKLVELGYPWRSEKAIRWRCFNPLRKRFEARVAAAEEAKGLPPRKKSRVALDRNVRLVQAAQERAASTE